MNRSQQHAAALAGIRAGPAGQGIVAAYLYGSHATGRAHRESDLDVGVVLRHADHPTPRDRFEAGLRLRVALQPALRAVPLDLVILNDAPPGLAGGGHRRSADPLPRRRGGARLSTGQPTACR